MRNVWKDPIVILITFNVFYVDVVVQLIVWYFFFTDRKLKLHFRFMTSWRKQTWLAVLYDILAFSREVWTCERKNVCFA